MSILTKAVCTWSYQNADDSSENIDCREKSRAVGELSQFQGINLTFLANDNK